MKLRDNTELRAKIEDLIRDRLMGMLKTHQCAAVILDAVDRALAIPTHFPPTCKQSLQVDPGTGGGAGDDERITPSEFDLKSMRRVGAIVPLEDRVPAAEPGKPATCPEACPNEKDCYAVGRCIREARP